MQILIQHTSGSKANRTDHFDTDSVSEITFGRDGASDVAYDPIQDDDVSRSHATLRVRKDNGIGFLLKDNNSTNGTRVNGERITEEVQLLPEDKVEFGVGGPSFIFDLQPRPASMMARTRVIPNAAATPASTRVISSPPPTSAPPRATATMASSRPGVGRETVMGILQQEMGMLQQERQATGRRWMAVTAAIVAVVILGGGALYWRMEADRQQASRALADANQHTADLMQVQQAEKDSHDLLLQKVGVTPAEIVRTYGNSTVQVRVHWRLYDKLTGMPAFHKIIIPPKGATQGRAGVRYLAYVRRPNQKLEPWLTPDGEHEHNDPMDVAGTGTGFVVDDSGFIITNKHVAAGWLAHFVELKEEQNFVIYDENKNFEPSFLGAKDLGLDDLKQIKFWIGSDISTMLDLRAPPRKRGSVEGRNDQLQVQFPGGSQPIDARLVRWSEEADIALIKIDVPRNVRKITFADENAPPIGAAVTVVGYPGTADLETLRYTTTNEAGDLRTQRDIIPEPTVVAGTIARLSDPIIQNPQQLIFGKTGDLYVLNAAADHGNSGGPVFDLNGKVIGVLTYGTPRETTTMAVPIKYAKALFE